MVLKTRLKVNVHWDYPLQFLIWQNLGVQSNFNGWNRDGSFTLPDWNFFLGPSGPIYETSVVKFLHLCFHDVIFIFYF